MDLVIAKLQGLLPGCSKRTRDRNSVAHFRPLDLLDHHIQDFFLGNISHPQHEKPDAIDEELQSISGGPALNVRNKVQLTR